ncbi:hypothetical protein PHET_05211 [Paragonimus heterotremus]|uniref:Uncharacterized protein n=1 Tax=Paragonimus heterotremus TaxID=100268 RepID=A0A8J4TFC3_9TREM|nr:hypothetical protein PHET_05211 [Paragonimus heterotremus]
MEISLRLLLANGNYFQLTVPVHTTIKEMTDMIYRDWPTCKFQFYGICFQVLVLGVNVIILSSSSADVFFWGIYLSQFIEGYDYYLMFFGRDRSG